MDKKHNLIVVVILFAAVAAWWFRFDTHCAGTTACVSFDRLTGQWIIPLKEANRNYAN